ncbi:MAG: UDP-N-acetylmuramate dehydrogenase [Vulcanimicrobiota bacterium]
MNTLISTEKMVPLAPFTTLELGGPAAQFFVIRSFEQALNLVESWWQQPPEERPELLPLGGGSNLLISDEGFPGLVLKMENHELRIESSSDHHVVVTAGAGMVWDDFVAYTVQQGWAGVECLSGIPGCVGASPVQNIGAYGQEVSETISAVHGIDLRIGQPFSYDPEYCEFSYRDSRFKRAGRGAFLITSVSFKLRLDGRPTIRYQDLQERCRERGVQTLAEVRELVLEIRRSKSMVYDRNDPNHRSAGSFFTNPIVTAEKAEAIQGSLNPGESMPRFKAGPGLEKLSAAWLIAQSGLPKGFKPAATARVGLSTNHVLALTNRGGATAEELLEFCRYVQGRVRSRFGIELVPEPVFVGF